MTTNRTQQALLASLERMGTWYHHMVHPKVQKTIVLHQRKVTYKLQLNRFVYEFDPVQQLHSMENCPIRELGSIWDVANLSVYLKRSDFTSIIQSHLDRFAMVRKRNFQSFHACF